MWLAEQLDWKGLNGTHCAGDLVDTLTYCKYSERKENSSSKPNEAEMSV
jgi:hypothetical protein